MSSQSPNIIHNDFIVRTDSSIARAGEGSTIYLNDGSVMVIYSEFYGKSDHDKANLVTRISRDQGVSWGRTKILKRPSPRSLNVMSTSLLRLKNGEIAFLYLEKYAKNKCIPKIMFSSDEAVNWSDPVTVTEERYYHVVNNDRLIQLTNGRLLIPYAKYTNINIAGRSPVCGVFYSDDNGLTWQNSEENKIKKRHVIPPHRIHDHDLWDEIFAKGPVCEEPGVVEITDNRVMMWIRTNGGYMYNAYSENNGISWSDFLPVKDIVSPQGPQSIKQLPGTSRLICLYNEHRDIPFGEPVNWNWRTPLSIAVSDDGGKNWTNIGEVEDKSHNYCYTSMMFFNDKLLLTYYSSENNSSADPPERWNLAEFKSMLIDQQELRP